MKKFLQKYPDLFDSFDNIWITSDMHFRHEKIHDFEPIREEIRLREGFQGTPDEFLIHKYNTQVKENDLVINLGDLHWKSLDPIAEKLNGTMLLVLGNHDMKPQYYYKFDDIYVVEGIWDLTSMNKPFEYFINSDDKLLSAFIYDDEIFSHYPIYNIEHEYNYQRTNNKIIPRMEIIKGISDNYSYSLNNVHGHLHSSCPEGTEKSLNVCIDFNRFKMINGNKLKRTDMQINNQKGNKMTYHYKCKNIQCKERNKEISINKPISEAGETEYCKECKEPLQRVFGSPGIKTSDGIK